MSTLAEAVRKHAEEIGAGRQRYIHGAAYFVACQVLEEDPGKPGLVFDRDDADEDNPHMRMVTLAFVLAKMGHEERPK